MNQQDVPIGRVIATENTPTTTGNVRFWLEAEAQLKPFDIVRLIPPNSQDGDFYVIITEIHQVSDEVSPLTGFVSADFGQSNIEPRMSRIVTTYADATVLYNTNQNEMPVPHGSRVHWPEADGVRRALGIDEFSRKIPAGFIIMSGPNRQNLSLPIDMDADYLIGPEGGHLNISGISGLATKTSYGMFLLTAIQQKQQEWDNGSQASFVILNVKGADLLQLHQEANDLDDSAKSDWGRCELTPAPLCDVTYFYPYSEHKEHAHVQSKLDKKAIENQVSEGQAYRFYYDLETAISRIQLLVEDIDDPNDTIVSCAIHSAENRNLFGSWDAYHDQLSKWAGATPDPKIPVVSWRRFFRHIGQRTKNEVFVEKSMQAEKLHQVPLADFLNHLQPGKAVVIDIAQLPDYLQSFVVGHVISLLREAKTGEIMDIDADIDEIEEEQALPLGTVILFADELNKFAPRHHAERSITRHLREISERGRSEGIILFGAEQFRTGVDDRVTGNSSTQVFGRTTAVEANRDPEIRGLPGRQSQRVPFLNKGELLVNHTRFSAGTLKIRFPKNGYRTQ